MSDINASQLSTAALSKSFTTVNGKSMAFHERGEGESTFLFLHGNPTSSYLWRNIIPHLELHGRCIAPDLIGMGDSEKLDDTGPDSYQFVEHRQYLDTLLDELNIGNSVTLIVHDWGSALGFDWAHRHPDRIAGIVYMESIVRAMEWDDWPDAATAIFEGMRSPAGEEMVMNKNLFVEAILPGSILRDLTDDEMSEYRRPFTSAADRRPTLMWPRQIPLAGEPADVVEIVTAYSDWLVTAEVPKLLVNAEPGAIMTGPQLAHARTFANQTEVLVAGNHFIQEDSPHEIGEAIVAWLATR